MGETINTIPPKGLWNLNGSDFIKGLIKTTGGLILMLIVKMIRNKFQLPPYEEISPILEAAVYFFFGYLGINYATNNEGKLFKADAPTTTVSAPELAKTVEKAESK